MGNKLLIGLYGRESTREQAQYGYNLDGQFRSMRMFVEKEYNTTDYREYREDGYSAKTLNRPVLNELKKDIEKGLVNVIVIYELNRLLRRLRQWYELTDLFEEYDVKVISVTDTIDSSTAMGRYQIHIKLANYELEQDVIGERTTRGLVEGARQGNFVKGGTVTFGYERNYVDKKKHYGKKKSLLVVPEEREILYKMRNWLLNGNAPYNISLLLREEEYLKSINKRFNENQVTRMLTDVVYCGKMKLQGNEYDMDYEKIFTLEQINEHKKIIKKRQKQGRYTYLFDGKVYNVDGSRCVNHSTVKKEKVFLYYFDTDSKKRLNEDKLLEQVLIHLQSNGLIYVKHRSNTFDLDVRRIIRKKEQIKKLYHYKKITYDTYVDALNDTKKQMIKLKKVHREYVECIHATFSNMTYKEKRLLIDMNINRIEVDFKTKQVVCIK